MTFNYKLISILIQFTILRFNLLNNISFLLFTFINLYLCFIQLKFKMYSELKRMFYTKNIMYINNLSKNSRTPKILKNLIKTTVVLASGHLCR